MYFKRNPSFLHAPNCVPKAYCGFKRHRGDEPDIATGKWGCGAFNGDPQLKGKLHHQREMATLHLGDVYKEQLTEFLRLFHQAVIQMMAAAKAKRGLAFFTFTDDRLKQDLEQIYHLLLTERITVGEEFSAQDISAVHSCPVLC